MEDIRAQNKALQKQVHHFETSLQFEQARVKHAQEDIQRLKIAHQDEADRFVKAHNEDMSRIQKAHEDTLALQEARHEEMLLMLVKQKDQVKSVLDGDTGFSCDRLAGRLLELDDDMRRCAKRGLEKAPSAAKQVLKQAQQALDVSECMLRGENIPVEVTVADNVVAVKREIHTLCGTHPAAQTLLLGNTKLRDQQLVSQCVSKTPASLVLVVGNPVKPGKYKGSMTAEERGESYFLEVMEDGTFTFKITGSGRARGKRLTVRGTWDGTSFKSPGKIDRSEGFEGIASGIEVSEDGSLVYKMRTSLGCFVHKLKQLR